MKDVNSEYVSEYIKSKIKKNTIYGKMAIYDKMSLNYYEENCTKYNSIYELLTRVFHEFHEAIYNYMHTEKKTFEKTCTLLPIKVTECLKAWDNGNAPKSEKRVKPFVDIMNAVIYILNGEEDVNYIGTDLETVKRINNNYKRRT